MKGTILDFLKLATEKPELTKELVELATKYDFEFSDEVSDEELECVAGGAARFEVLESLAASEIDSAKSSADAATDLFKMSLATLADAVERRDDAITKMTNT